MFDVRFVLLNAVQGNENTKTALMFTAQLNRSAGVVRVLLEHGADINQSTNRCALNMGSAVMGDT